MYEPIVAEHISDDILWSKKDLSVSLHRHYSIAFTVSSWKYAAPFCTLLWSKSGEGVFARMFNLSCAYAPSLHSSQYFIRERLTITTTAVAFWIKERQLRWTYYTGNEWHLPKGIEITWIVSCDRERSRTSSCFQCKQQQKQKLGGG